MSQRKAAAVSMEHDLYARAKARAAKLGFPTFSAYMVQLLRADLIRRGDLTLMEETGDDQSLPPRQPVSYEAAKPKRKP